MKFTSFEKQFFVLLVGQTVSCALLFLNLISGRQLETRGQFLENCAQLLGPTPNFLTAFSGEEVEH